VSAAAVALRGLLASALAPPSAESVDDTAELAETLAELPGAPASLRALASELAGCDASELAVAHERLFTGDVRLPPYEGSYEIDPFRQARQMADVAGFYRAFGADAHGPETERPDHAGTELEFLAFLGLRRLEAETGGDEETATRCAEIEDDFLTAHAGRWLPVFFSRLADEAAHPVHRALGAVGHDAVVAELTGRGLVVEPVPVDRRPRTAVEDDELTCAAADDPAAALRPDRPA
jgi:putative dimethyl sulfoxide reductase chaperone